MRSTKSSTCAWVNVPRSQPLGRYLRNILFACSTPPFCRELYGSQKNVGTGAPTALRMPLYCLFSIPLSRVGLSIFLSLSMAVAAFVNDSGLRFGMSVAPMSLVVRSWATARAALPCVRLPLTTVSPPSDRLPDALLLRSGRGP
jgi:hypothetical protein